MTASNCSRRLVHDPPVLNGAGRVKDAPYGAEPFANRVDYAPGLFPVPHIHRVVGRIDPEACQPVQCVPDPPVGHVRLKGFFQPGRGHRFAGIFVFQDGALDRGFVHKGGQPGGFRGRRRRPAQEHQGRSGVGRQPFHDRGGDAPGAAGDDPHGPGFIGDTVRLWWCVRAHQFEGHPVAVVDAHFNGPGCTGVEKFPDNERRCGGVVGACC